MNSDIIETVGAVELVSMSIKSYHFTIISDSNCTRVHSDFWHINESHWFPLRNKPWNLKMLNDASLMQ